MGLEQPWPRKDVALVSSRVATFDRDGTGRYSVAELAPRSGYRGHVPRRLSGAPGREAGFSSDPPCGGWRLPAQLWLGHGGLKPSGLGNGVFAHPGLGKGVLMESSGITGRT
jgi:hypothetical protein